MDANFWYKRWENNDIIAFHESKANPLLFEHLHHLSLTKGARVFLPLCGKTLDIHWLLSNGYCVAGAELSKIAVEQLFTELGIKPETSAVGAVYRYSANNIDIFVGNIFDLSGTMLGKVDAIYDRAALVALPEKMRRGYAAHLQKITDQATQLLICYEYDQSLMDGPPFSVRNREVKELYEGNYHLTFIESNDVHGGLKGICAAKENVWLLKNG